MATIKAVLLFPSDNTSDEANTRARSSGDTVPFKYEVVDNRLEGEINLAEKIRFKMGDAASIAMLIVRINGTSKQITAIYYSGEVDTRKCCWCDGWEVCARDCGCG